MNRQSIHVVNHYIFLETRMQNFNNLMLVPNFLTILRASYDKFFAKTGKFTEFKK